MVGHGTLGAVSQRTRIARLVVVLAMLTAACGEERFFDVVVVDPPVSKCPGHADFTAFAVLVWQGDNDFIGCVESVCATVGQSARDCLAGVETPELTPGRSARFKAMLFAGPPNQPPVWCGDGVNPEIDFDSGRVDIGLKCGDNCQSIGCQPETCMTERNSLCQH